MAFTTDITCHLITIGKPYASDFPQCRVRLFGSGRVHARAHSAFLRTCRKGRYVRLLRLTDPRFSYKLIDRWHSSVNHALESAKPLPRVQQRAAILGRGLIFVKNCRFLALRGQVQATSAASVSADSPKTSEVLTASSSDCSLDRRLSRRRRFRSS